MKRNVIFTLIGLLIIVLYRNLPLSQAKAETAQTASERTEYYESLTLPAIALRGTSKSTFSQIGGVPSLPADISWPHWNKKPLSFLCQIDLSQLKSKNTSALPSEGVLYFFYDQDQETWGFDPKDQGSWKVIYSPKTPANCSKATAPKGLKEHGRYKEKPVILTDIKTYPDWQDERIEALNLDDFQGEAYWEMCISVYNDQPAHQLFGHATPIQDNGMARQAQLVSNGLNLGDGSGYKDPRVKELEKGADQWILLFQLDSDDDAEMMWGDVGMLYFWIKKDDLAKKNFDNVWMIFQCG